MIKCVIFDLDGVLVSTDQLHYRAWKRLADEIEIADYDIQDNEKQRGISRMASLEVLLQKSRVIYTIKEKEELADRKNRYYQELLLTFKEDILLPGAIKTLNFLKDKNLKIAIGSSSKNAMQIIEKIKIQQFIDVCVCGVDVIHTKPNPEIFLKAAEEINVTTKSCLVVEDSVAGIDAAKKAGMRTLGVGCYSDKLEADYTAKDLESVNDWEKILQ